MIDQALANVERATGRRPNLDAAPLDDREVYELLASGDSVGVFHFESDSMRRALREVSPTEFDDLVALIALDRFGAEDHIPAYARGKRDPESVVYAHERLRPILSVTYGLNLYQEQAMQIATSLAGFSPDKANELRKAVGKKKRPQMDALKLEFIDGCMLGGLSEEHSRAVWEDIYRASDWSFCRAHAASYALIAYRTAWLKAHHRDEYMAALGASGPPSAGGRTRPAGDQRD